MASITRDQGRKPVGDKGRYSCTGLPRGGTRGVLSYPAGVCGGLLLPIGVSEGDNVNFLNYIFNVLLKEETTFDQTRSRVGRISGV